MLPSAALREESRAPQAGSPSSPEQFLYGQLCRFAWLGTAGSLSLASGPCHQRGCVCRKHHYHESVCGGMDVTCVCPCVHGHIGMA